MRLTDHFDRLTIMIRSYSSALFLAIAMAIPAISLAAPTAKPKPKAAVAKPAKTSAIQPGPQQVVDRFAKETLQAALANNDKPEIFRREVDRQLLQLVNFRTFSKRVMGSYASEKSLAALAPAEQRRRKEQISRFAVIFRTALVQSYSSAFLLAAKGVSIETAPLSRAPDPAKPAVIRQQLLGLTEQALDIIYQMEVDDGKWQLRNLSVAGINLGKLYKNQFSALAAKHKGNLDAAIDDWIAETPQD